jgi:hypothetical protein
MDPLSIIASSITIATALQLAVAGVCRVKQGEADIVSVALELSDLRLVLKEAQEILEEDSASRDAERLNNVLLHIQASLECLEGEFCKRRDEYERGSRTYRGRIKKPLRWMTAHKTARKLRNDLRDGRDQLVAVLSTYSA